MRRGPAVGGHTGDAGARARALRRLEQALRHVARAVGAAGSRACVGQLLVAVAALFCCFYCGAALLYCISRIIFHAGHTSTF